MPASDAALPSALQNAIEAALGCSVSVAGVLSGGDVNRAVQIQTGTGLAVLKWHETASRDVFLCEADGLQALGETGTLRVPHVLAVGGDETAPALLVLEWIPPGSPQNMDTFSRRFAHGLAQMHQTTAERGEKYGYAINNYLGSQPQTNTPRTSDWAAFYRDNRIVPQWERARKLHCVPAEREKLLGDVLEKLPGLLNEMPPDASLIHGDLWSGNFLCASADNDAPVLIDPAVYYGPREMELAYIELFGGFPPNFVANYHATWSLDNGYPARRPLHQLYPLLIHLNHFGETYGPRVDAACRACLR